MNNPLKVLLVEDNPGDALLIEEMLADAAPDQIIISCVETLAQAIKELGKKNMDLVLLDLNLPDSNGIKTLLNVCRKIPWIPVVVLTGQDDETLGIESVKAGAQDYLIKGEVSGDLLKRVACYAVERHQAQQASRESENFLRSTLDAISSSIAILKNTGEILSINHAWQQFAMENNADLPSVSPGVNYLDVCTRAAANGDLYALEIGDGIKNVISGKIDHFEFKYPCHSTNEKRWFHCKVTPFPDQENRRVVIVHENITSQEMAREELRQAQKMESLGILAGGIAHDFNNILSAMLGYTKLIMDEVADNESLMEDLNEIYRAGIRATELVRQILTFSRRVDWDLHPLNPGIIIKEALRLLRSTLPTTIEIQQTIDKGLKPILADPVQIHQIIMNLCTNAAHAMEPDGGVLTVTLKQKQMKSADFLELAIRDTGCGMTPELIELIFDPYFTTKKLGEGTGLGLSVVHGIVKEYGGKIITHSTPGKGTCFSLYFPCILKQINDEKSENHSVLPRGSERILLVDDEAPITKLTTRILKGLGYDVTPETDSVKALELFKKNPGDFDLVITDMTMPRLTGETLAMELLKINPQIPIILCSGFTTQMTQEKANKLGIKAFIQKPIEKEYLALTIRKILT